MSAPDAYRIGWHWWEDWSARRTMRVFRPSIKPVKMRRSRDRWHRCWQAEWPDCQRAVRAYTRLGVIRKAVRAQRGES